MPRAKGVPTVGITLDGRTYKIDFTWGARLRISDYFQSLGKDPAKVSRFESFAATIWAGMEDEDRQGISVTQIAEMIHPGNEPEILARIDELVGKSEPDPDPNAVPSAAKVPAEGERPQSTISGRLVSTT